MCENLIAASGGSDNYAVAWLGFDILMALFMCSGLIMSFSYCVIFLYLWAKWLNCRSLVAWAWQPFFAGCNKHIIQTLFIISKNAPHAELTCQNCWHCTALCFSKTLVASSLEVLAFKLWLWWCQYDTDFLSKGKWEVWIDTFTKARLCRCSHCWSTLVLTALSCGTSHNWS